MQESGIYDYICKNKNKKDALIFQEEQFQSQFLLETQKYYKNEIDDKLNLTTTEFINWANSISNQKWIYVRECYPNSYQAQIQQLKLIIVSNQAARPMKQNFSSNIYSNQGMNNQNIKGLNNSVVSQQQIDQKNEAELYYTNILRLMEKTQDICFNQLEKEPESKIYTHEKSPKILAIYIDIIIRRDEGRNEIETDKLLTQIFCLFQLLYQRDIFFSTLLRTIIQKIAQFLVQTSLTLKIEITKNK